MYSNGDLDDAHLINREMSYEGLSVIFTDNEGNKKGKKRNIVYPSFYVMAEECSDSFWKYKLIEFSVSKIPTGYRYIPQSRTLVYKKRSKDYILELGYDTTENIENFKAFMRKTAGIISPLDDIHEEVSEAVPQEELTWSSVMKSRNMCSLYINKYCQEMKRNHRLNTENYNSLLWAMDDLCLSGMISKCVIFESDGIQDIDGLYRDSNTGNFYIEVRKTKKTVSKSRKVGSKSGDPWSKVLDAYIERANGKI